MVLAVLELEQPDEFNGQFTAVFNKSEHTQVPLPNCSAPSWMAFMFRAEGVKNFLKALLWVCSHLK